MVWQSKISDQTEMLSLKLFNWFLKIIWLIISEVNKETFQYHSRLRINLILLSDDSQSLSKHKKLHHEGSTRAPGQSEPPSARLAKKARESNFSRRIVEMLRNPALVSQIRLAAANQRKSREVQLLRKREKVVMTFFEGFWAILMGCWTRMIRF